MSSSGEISPAIKEISSAPFWLSYSLALPPNNIPEGVHKLMTIKLEA
jgi:hypothetical protein